MPVPEFDRRLPDTVESRRHSETSGGRSIPMSPPEKGASPGRNRSRSSFVTPTVRPRQSSDDSDLYEYRGARPESEKSAPIFSDTKHDGAKASELETIKAEY
eukprot:TRINITY_DN49369_c0_g1_i2.p1 TRINITY_DN49369_c0_g1~~TRINITY_DN49369_c0_g1_i2.p1  ORF type:complete len:102 (+),score=8.05 TRINITY_DN49369_c0_g1_i2:107-412(+)